eukprot:COSAG02_NODE_282_length_25773_cov_1666.149762_10_plen_247_part_00
MERQRQQLESLERAVEEVEALDAIYGYDSPGGFEIHTEAELALAKSTLDTGRTPSADWIAPRLDIELRVEVEAPGEAAVAASSTVRLRCGLPPGYPAESAAKVSVGVDGLTRASQDMLTRTLQAKADELTGEEAIMELVQELQNVSPAILADELTAATADMSRSCSVSSDALPQFGRRWIVSHHLKNPTKRSNIVAWARELELGGYSKPGYPGCVVVEGEASACAEFFQRLRTKTGNWKNLVLRKG